MRNFFTAVAIVLVLIVFGLIIIRNERQLDATDQVIAHVDAFIASQEARENGLR